MNERTIKLIGENNFNKLKTINILIVGIGGVGQSALETLVRSGCQNITIIDYDTFDLSNLNRQIISNRNNIGKLKVDEALLRYKDINENINLEIKNIFLNEDNIQTLDNYDYIIDACDTVDTKVSLIRYAINNNIKIISCMGTGKRLEPQKLKISTLNKTYNDPLAKVMRRKLQDINTKKVSVVFSEELPLNNNKIISSMMMVPATAGIYMASFIINDMIDMNSIK